VEVDIPSCSKYLTCGLLVVLEVEAVKIILHFRRVLVGLLLYDTFTSVIPMLVVAIDVPEDGEMVTQGDMPLTTHVPPAELLSIFARVICHVMLDEIITFSPLFCMSFAGSSISSTLLWVNY
jgi:hypothetical protein